MNLAIQVTTLVALVVLVLFCCFTKAPHRELAVLTGTFLIGVYTGRYGDTDAESYRHSRQ